MQPVVLNLKKGFNGARRSKLHHADHGAREKYDLSWGRETDKGASQGGIKQTIRPLGAALKGNIPYKCNVQKSDEIILHKIQNCNES